jgi:hypothetical protein
MYNDRTYKPTINENSKKIIESKRVGSSNSRIGGTAEKVHDRLH